MQLKQTIHQQCGMESGAVIIVGVSGGPDSLCLLDILRQMEYKIIAAHLDHALRSESAQDAESVSKIAAEWSIPLVSRREEVGRIAGERRWSIEEAARVVRYRFLFEQAVRFNAAAVAVAHSADDQVETVLMHLLRGSGIAGLKGMQYCSILPEWHDHIPLIRPLLGIWRREILTYCEARGLVPLQDSSNFDVTYFRNRLRHELIPYLEQYNPRVKDAIWRMSQGLTGDYVVLQMAVQEAWQQCCPEINKNYIYLQFSTLVKFPLGIQRGLIRQAVALLLPDLRDVDYASIERATDFFANPAASRRIDLVNDLFLMVEEDRLLIARQDADLPLEHWPQILSGERLNIPENGRVFLPHRWFFDSAVSYEPFSPEMGDPYHAWFDADALEQPLYVRSFQAGDRIQPLGMAGKSIKLADLWTNEHLPSRARRGWPLVCSGEKIIWVPGYRQADFCRVSAATRRVVHLQLACLPPLPGQVSPEPTDAASC